MTPEPAVSAPPPPPRDHGGGVDAAAARWGGRAADWLDLSTGINPVAWPGPGRALPRCLSARAWGALPDSGAEGRLLAAARAAFRVPEGAALLALPGASAAIARIPHLAPAGRAAIPGPTYNEHAAAFGAAGWAVDGAPMPAAADALVVVHPNNPDGRLWRAETLPPAPLTVIDESFCDAVPGASLMRLAARPGVLVLRSFGKFWGLAGLRLGFAAGDPALVGALAEALGPWPVSGPALEIGALALEDGRWAEAARSAARGGRGPARRAGGAAGAPRGGHAAVSALGGAGCGGAAGPAGGGADPGAGVPVVGAPGPARAAAAGGLGAAGGGARRERAAGRAAAGRRPGRAALALGAGAAPGGADGAGGGARWTRG